VSGVVQTGPILQRNGGQGRLQQPTIPVGGAALAVPFLEETKQTLDDQDHPVVIANYGSSQGKNALAQWRLQFKTCGPGSPGIARFLYFISISRRMISIPCSKY